MRGLNTALAVVPGRTKYRKHLAAHPPPWWNPDAICAGWPAMLDGLKLLYLTPRQYKVYAKAVLIYGAHKSKKGKGLMMRWSRLPKRLSSACDPHHAERRPADAINFIVRRTECGEGGSCSQTFELCRSVVIGGDSGPELCAAVVPQQLGGPKTPVARCNAINFTAATLSTMRATEPNTRSTLPVILSPGEASLKYGQVG